MRYYYEKPEQWVGAGEIYICNHPLYNRCTLFKTGNRGIAIVQEHFDTRAKTRWWGIIEPWIAGDIYQNPGFKQFFNEHAAEADENGIFPTFTLRKIMWALKMKPLKKECWEEDI